MRAWTNGRRHIALTSTGLHIWEGEEHRAISSIRAPGKLDWGCLAVSPSGKLAWSRDESGAAMKVSLDGEAEEQTFPWLLHAVRCVDEKQVVAATSGKGKSKIVLVSGEPPKTQKGWKREQSLGNPGRVQWPELVWADGKAPWGRRRSLGTADSVPPDGLRLDHNRFGVAFADNISGIVGLLREGVAGVEAIRVPSQEEAMLFGAATKEGVLVSLAVEGRESALCHFDAEGNCLGSLELWGLGPARVLDAKNALAVACEGDTGGDLVLRVLRLPALKEVAQFKIGCKGNSGDIDLAVAPKGKQLVVGGDDRAWLGQLANKEWSFTLLAPARKRTSKAPYSPRLSEGGPEIAFPVLKKAAPAWSFDAEEDVTFEAWIRSAGAPTSGLRVSISGEAIDAGLFEPTVADVEEHSQEFKRTEGSFDVELPVEIPHGFAHPLDPKPSGEEAKEAAQEALTGTHLKVQIRGKTHASGNGMLVLQLAVPEQATPIKWMRPFSVD